MLPIVLKDTLHIQDSTFDGKHKFACGHEVPVYEVHTLHSLNQIIGHAKFNNRKYGNVYYRGECRIHANLTPSLFRKAVRQGPHQEHLNTIVKRLITDKKFKTTLNVGKSHEEEKVEGLLQHYGVPTRYIDVVDNHWVALWMGLNKCHKYKNVHSYYRYKRREIPLGEFAVNGSIDRADLYQYILLIALPYGLVKDRDGVTESKDYLQIDLRQALPSVFLRPHAQHGLVFRRKVHQLKQPSEYDVADTVIGILKIRIDCASEWLGYGNLLTQDNLFPAPGYDHGYDILLSKEDLFKDSEFSIARYI